MMFELWFLLFVLGHLGDSITTFIGLYYGAEEKNPFFHWIFVRRYGLYGGLGFKMGLVLAITLYISKCLNRYVIFIVEDLAYTRLLLDSPLTILSSIPLNLAVYFNDAINITLVSLILCIILIFVVVVNNSRVIVWRYRAMKRLKDYDVGDYWLTNPKDVYCKWVYPDVEELRNDK